MLTEADVEEIGRTKGLVTGARLIGFINHGNDELLAALARGASSRNALISESDAGELGELTGSSFFEVQNVLCEVIPRLTSQAADIMSLVSVLVEKGGEDLAAHQPYVAFRKWCEVDGNRAAEVIASARAGNALSLQHLVFALEAKADAEDALMSASAAGEERTAGALALSRMNLTQDQATVATNVVLDAAEGDFTAEVAGFINAALDIASKHPELDRARIAIALARLSQTGDPIAVHLMANALYWHHANMNEAELAICLSGIQAIDHNNAGTVRQIHDALPRLWLDRPDQVSKALAAIISRTEGKVGKGALSGISRLQKPDEQTELAKLATEWLLNGDYYQCSALASQFSEINRSAPCLTIHPEVLPPDEESQIFICRKAIGYFFLAPMTAASWIIAVLRQGGHASADAAELLFDPLLLNYAGALKAWLEKLLEDDAPGNDSIRDALKRAQDIWDGFHAAREIVELEPSSAQRALVRFQEAEESEKIHESAQKQSIFANLFTQQTLLYGDRSSFSITDDEGNRRAQKINMAQMSVSSELPKGIFFDPVGTDWTLEMFRHEQRRRT